MAAPIQSTTITQGDRVEIRITLTHDNGSPYDLVVEDQTPRMQLRTSPSASVSAEFSASIEGDDNNVVVLILSSTASLALATGTYGGRLLLQHNADATLDQITRTHYRFTVEASETQR